MDATIIDETKLTNIANAIREKTGETALLSPSGMVTAIAEIPTPEPYEWDGGQDTVAWGIIAINTDNINEYEVYGVSIAFLAKSMGASDVIDFRNVGNLSSLLATWLGYLPDGGTCLIRVTTTQFALLSATTKNDVTGKGYTWERV